MLSCASLTQEASAKVKLFWCEFLSKNGVILARNSVLYVVTKTARIPFLFEPAELGWIFFPYLDSCLIHRFINTNNKTHTQAIFPVTSRSK